MFALTALGGPATGSICPDCPAFTMASNTAMPWSTSSIGTGYGLRSLIARANAVSSALSMSKPACSLSSSGGAVTGPVGACSDVGTKRNLCKVGFEISASPLLP